MKILIGDSHWLVQEALQDVLSELTESDTTILTASRSEEVLTLADTHPDLDLVLIELLLLGQTEPLETLEALRRDHPVIPVLVVSGILDRTTIHSCLELGAMGYLPKSASKSSFIHALQLVLSGEIYVPPDLIDPSPLPAPIPKDYNDYLSELGFTPRQREILSLIVRGRPDKSIARTLGISVQTVKNHQLAIRGKLGVHTRTELIYKLTQLNVPLDLV